ncbi:hypothetical protein [Nocardioides sp. W7]|uniref:hypothetical protein n=1 Tax=Nocardioides sp. W7 TaxID=2931390 RepID=UPI001FD0F72A|nr:hypothetical protein [Nocardioides sp. W7]
MHRARRPLVAVAAVALSVLLSSCSAIGDLTGGGDDPVEAESPSATPTETVYDSQFTRDGTFQSHIDVNGVDFVYNMYPTKATPRTNEWFPRGNKYFSFTLGAYDLDRDLRDPFKTKRKVYLDRIKVTSRTVLKDGSAGTDRPYELNASAKKITFDPEPVSTKYGMLITSPKGAFELRNQQIGEMAPDTRGVNLSFRATVWIENSAGSGTFFKQTIKQEVPIAIFASEEETVVADIPVNAG